ncbi:MAG: hypothetical protein WBC44_11340 [Planctomycetaceae bacterium]
MNTRLARCCRRSGLLLALSLVPTTAFPIAGTDKIADKGQSVTASPNWPQGLVDVVNDPARTDGWNDWFSEWPNDVVHYQFQFAETGQINVTGTGQINLLLKKFAAVRASELHVHLSPQQEPRGYGWVSSLPAGNGTPVMLSFGDQQRIDEWYQCLGGRKFGVMEFEGVPVAVPLTLTIYTRHPAVDLDRLEIPDNLTVTVGDVPRVFHDWKTKPKPEVEIPINRKHQDESNPALRSVEATTPASPADEALQAQIERLEEFVAKRNQRLDGPAPPKAAEPKS